MNKTERRKEKFEKFPIDRSSWKSGPWDNEPDYHEWTTKAGYEAFAGRLDMGTWYGYVVAPHPPYDMHIKFHRFMKKLNSMGIPPCFTGRLGLVAKTDIENVGEFCFSFEHNAPPSDPDKKCFGPYKTLEETIETCEKLAEDLLLLNNDETLYINFDRYG